CFFFFQAEDGIRDRNVTGVQTCALPISLHAHFFTRDRNFHRLCIRDDVFAQARLTSLNTLRAHVEVFLIADKSVVIIGIGRSRTTSCSGRSSIVCRRGSSIICSGISVTSLSYLGLAADIAVVADITVIASPCGARTGCACARNSCSGNASSGGACASSCTIVRGITSTGIGGGVRGASLIVVACLLVWAFTTSVALDVRGIGDAVVFINFGLFLWSQRLICVKFGGVFNLVLGESQVQIVTFDGVSTQRNHRIAHAK